MKLAIEMNETNFEVEVRQATQSALAVVRAVVTVANGKPFRTNKNQPGSERNHETDH